MSHLFRFTGWAIAINILSFFLADSFNLSEVKTLEIVVVLLCSFILTELRGLEKEVKRTKSRRR